MSVFFVGMISVVLSNNNAPVVQRVHWLRARCQRNRWQEEVILVEYEMKWTVNYFMNRAIRWRDHAITSHRDVHAGAAAYARRQEETWKSMAVSAQSTFRNVQSW
jgi:hypothetical protein